MYEILKFKDHLHDRPKPSGIDMLCKLQHFAIVTYAIPPERFKDIIPPRFKLDTVNINGEEKALISVVPFFDMDFTSAVFPFFKFKMGQTNYRIYIIDQDTGKRAVWFLGTTLDSWIIFTPHVLWNLPLYRGSVKFDCIQDENSGLYTQYKMTTKSKWASVDIDLYQDISHDFEFDGFPDIETSLVYLTHLLDGFYHRRDGKLGTYNVWHKKLEVKPARLKHAKFGLLERMGLVNLSEQQNPYNALIEPINEFTIYMPPKVIK
ncbi:MAG: hypothetical protein RLZZ210_4 [Pseudomonadota bacterium]